MEELQQSGQGDPELDPQRPLRLIPASLSQPAFQEVGQQGADVGVGVGAGFWAVLPVSWCLFSRQMVGGDVALLSSPACPRGRFPLPAKVLHFQWKWHLPLRPRAAGISALSIPAWAWRQLCAPVRPKDWPAILSCLWGLVPRKLNFPQEPPKFRRGINIFFMEGWLDRTYWIKKLNYCW